MIRILAPLLLAFAASVSAATHVVPSEPIEFETVTLRLDTDSCAYVPSTTRVSMAGNVIRVTQQLNACLVPGELRIVDVRLGAFPVGDYAVEVYATPQPTGTPAQRLTFRVVGHVEPAVFPPPTRPLADYSGVWFNPSEGGWGLFLHQSPISYILWGAWFVYAPDGTPEWYTLQDGRWTNHATWTATVYRNSGPWLFDLPFDTRRVSMGPVGTATLDFTLAPTNGGRVEFRYRVNGLEDTKTIRRLVF